MCSTRYGCLLYFLNEHDSDTNFTIVKYKLYIFFYNFGSSSEIPQFRLPYDVVNFELELVKDLGVKVSIFFLSLFMIVCNVVNLKHKKCLFWNAKVHVHLWCSFPRLFHLISASRWNVVNLYQRTMV